MDSLRPDIFKAIRLRLGLSQAELAGLLKVSRVSVNKWETGKLIKGIPSWVPDELLKLQIPTARQVAEIAGPPAAEAELSEKLQAVDAAEKKQVAVVETVEARPSDTFWENIDEEEQ